MNDYTEDELIDALNTIESLIERCETFQDKFEKGTSQYSLLKNRINALYISKSLIKNKDIQYEKEELEKALPPIVSIINKCSKAISKYEVNTKQYNRFLPIINAMKIAQTFIENHLFEE